MLVDLKGKTAIVTGGGAGAGRGIALALAREGMKVAAVGRRPDMVNETVALFAKDPANGGEIHPMPGDIADRKRVAEIVRETESKIGPIWLLVNNAGINIPKRRLEVLSYEDWDKLIQVNLTGTFNMLHSVLPHMRSRKDGVVVNISSIAGKRASVLGGAAYSASKFGVTALSGVLGLEEAPNGIRSTAICPGEINTPILDQRPVPVSAERKATMLQPEDIAAAVLLVAKLPPTANIPELIIKPTLQEYA
jgi:NADP-dependent 3-hydroxy acid dehydrogenase YdfG